MKIDKLVFVYNADSGVVNAVIDTAHKLISPDTYSCNLCAITFSLIGEHRNWKEFKKTLGIEHEFLHRDEVESVYGLKNQELPAIYAISKSSIRLLISKEQIDQCETVACLADLVTATLEEEQHRD